MHIYIYIYIYIYTLRACLVGDRGWDLRSLRKAVRMPSLVSMICDFCISMLTQLYTCYLSVCMICRKLRWRRALDKAANEAL